MGHFEWTQIVFGLLSVLSAAGEVSYMPSDKGRLLSTILSRQDLFSAWPGCGVPVPLTHNK